MLVLGINAYIHDSAAALVHDGRIVAAAAEERFTREKHDARLPVNAVSYCLREAGAAPTDLDHVAFYWDPYLTMRKRIWPIIRYFPHSLVLWKKHDSERATMASGLKMLGARRRFNARCGANIPPSRFHYVEHHNAHAASAFYCSEFGEAAIWSVDGTGEWTTTLFAEGRGNGFRRISDVTYPNSLGVFYAAVTQYLGFKPASDEWKVMGLAPYGKPIYKEKFMRMFRLLPTGGFALDMSYFDFQYASRERWYSKKMVEEFGPPGRNDENVLAYADIACSAQAALEEVAFHCVGHLTRKTGQRNLCIAGGVGLNCVMNGKLLAAGAVDGIYIQPAAGDDGTSLGAALYVTHNVLGLKRGEPMRHAYLGPSFSDEEIEASLRRMDVAFTRPPDISAAAARLMADGAIIGWFQGRMEFGSRALGGRSILADPRDASVRDKINARVKFREFFRPFAPAVLAEDCGEYFDLSYPSPFMLLVYQVKPEKRGAIPAVTHADNSGRVQTVERDVNPRYYDLIRHFKRLTGVGVVLNTSFNVKDEPIVLSPEDAVRCFRRAGLDALCIGPFLVTV